ncbi:putative reverse transcriptase domain-containing protein [Tanacetum coccineum]
MSDSEDSTVTYTEVYSPFEGLSDIGSSGVDGLPMMLEDPYVEAALQAPPSLDYDEAFPVEEQPLPATVLPTADSPGYIADSDLKEDPEEDLVDYPVDGGDDDDGDDESSDDDKDDDDDVEEDEEEEHPAPADSVPPPVHHLSPLPQIPSPPLPVSSPVPVSPPPLPDNPTYPLGCRAAMIQLRAETLSTSHLLPSSTPPSGTPPLLPIPLHIPSLPLLLPSTVCRAGVFDVTLPPQKRLCIALGPRYEVGESSSTPTARPTGDTWDEMLVGMPRAPATHDTELGRRMTDFVMTVRQDIDEIYGRLDDAQDDRLLMSGRLNMLHRDRRAHARIARLMETETILSCEAWVQSMDASDTARSEVRALRTTVLAQQTEISRATRSTPATTTATTTTVTNAQLKAMIDQGVTNALAARDADRTTNRDDSHNSGTGVRRTERVARDISNCSVENQIKFSTCTLLACALTWWNSHVKTVGHDVAYAMTWTDLKKKMTDKYYPRGEIKKLEAELWNLKVKGTNVIGYNQCFQELALLCVRMFSEASNKIDRYVGGLPNMIHGSVVASKPKTMQEAIEIATKLMDKNICQKPTCYESGTHGHFKRDCPKLKNNNRGNRDGNGNASAKVYAVGHAGTNPDSNVVTGTFLLNNHYAFVLFDTGADRSFVSTTFSSQIDITPTALDHYYDVKLADGRIIGLNTIIRGYTLNFLNHPFNIDLMPVELGSLDVIIDMDWLAKYQAVIVCAEKIIHIPWGNKTLIALGDGSDRGNETRLNIILCTKTQKYMLKGCPVFLAHVTTKVTEDKSENK